MKTIKQNVELNFSTLEFEEKIVLLPFMCKLAESVKNNVNLNINIDADDNPLFVIPEVSEKALKILSDLGCRTALGESYEDIIKLRNKIKQTNNALEEVKQETINTKKIDIYDANQEEIINKFKTNVHIENVKMFEELLEILSTIEKSIVIYPKFKVNLENKNEKELVAIISHILREPNTIILNDEASATLHDNICESSAMLQYNDLLKYRLMLKNFIELGGILLIKIDILKQ